MRCSRRSTTWAGRAVAAIGLVALVATGTRAADTPLDPGREAEVPAAIVAAVRERVGSTARVELGDVRVHLGRQTVDGPLQAVPQPGARTGGRVAFTLVAVTDGAHLVRIGSADAIVRVFARHARTRRAMPRATVLTAADIESVDGDIGRQPLRAIADPLDYVGATVRRDVMAGERLTPEIAAPVPLVRSGDRVVLRATIGGVTASGEAIAWQSGDRHAVIRLVNPDSGRVLEGRVIGRGEVEVLNEF